MSYQGSWKIDDLLTFCVNTTRFDTGAATDADSVATYRVYEDETGTPILTGSMALLDSANTAGFYSEQITLSAANGFEKGKSYNIYIAATVNSVAGATHHNFQMEAEVDANVVSATNISTNVTQISGDTTAADNAEAFFDGTGYAGTNNVIPLVTTTTTTTTATNVTTVNGLAAAVITAASIASNAITSAKIAAGAITAAGIATDAIDADALATDAVNEIADGLLGRVITESFSVVLAAPTVQQVFSQILAVLQGPGYSGTTMTAKKIDGTPAMTFTLNDAVNPTSMTRTT